MLIPVFVVIGAMLLTALIIFLDDPKPHNWRELGRYSTLYKSSLRENYPSEREVFRTLKEAGIKPCFLSADLEKGDN